MAQFSLECGIQCYCENCDNAWDLEKDYQDFPYFTGSFSERKPTMRNVLWGRGQGKRMQNPQYRYISGIWKKEQHSEKIFEESMAFVESLTEHNPGWRCYHCQTRRHFRRIAKVSFASRQSVMKAKPLVLLEFWELMEKFGRRKSLIDKTI